MQRSSTNSPRPKGQPRDAGKHASYAPRIIGFAILIAAVLFVVVGLVTA
jgi:hypothetical protein